MGTSKSYSASIKGQPQWGKLSGIVTSNCNGTTVSNSSLGKILNRYVIVIGGASRAGGGKSRIGGKGAIRTAKRLGGFLSAFSSSGGNLQSALSETGLTDLSGKTVADIINHLIEFCSGPTITIDDKAAKEASRILLEELSSEAKTIEELAAVLKSQLDTESLEEIIVKYFSYYILEHLSVMFYEKLITEKGKNHCNDLFRQIKEFIFERLKEINKTSSLKDVDWGSDTAERLIKKIYQDVLTVFESHED